MGQGRDNAALSVADLRAAANTAGDCPAPLAAAMKTGEADAHVDWVQSLETAAVDAGTAWLEAVASAVQAAVAVTR